jgi:hypothetical protein
MANAIKEISVVRGYDVTRYTLNCFGWAGGQHACLKQIVPLLARESALGSQRDDRQQDQHCGDGNHAPFGAV